MKSSLLITTALGAVFVGAPAFAQEVSGYADVSYTDVDIESPIGDADGDGWSIGGAVAIPLQAWGMQFDVRYTDSDDLLSDPVIQGTGHVHARSDRGLIGGFAGFADQGNDELWAVGLEGQYYMEQMTLSGAVGYGQIDDADTDFWGAQGGLGFFVNENFRLDANVGWSQVNFDLFDVDADVWNVGVGLEYQFATVPVSLFADYNHSEADEDDFGDTDIDAIHVGIRWNYGGTTLMQRDRYGASLKPLGGLANAFSSF